MRAQDPVFCQPGIDGKTPIWFVTRHDDVVAVLLDDERFVRDPVLALGEEELGELSSGMPESMSFIEAHMLNKDGADHRRLRRLVTKAFTPKMVGQGDPGRLPARATSSRRATPPRTAWRRGRGLAQPRPRGPLGPRR
jgi:cytochrome P450